MGLTRHREEARGLGTGTRRASWGMLGTSLRGGLDRRSSRAAAGRSAQARVGEPWMSPAPDRDEGLAS